MDFIEVKLLSGSSFAIRKDLILCVLDMPFISKETVKKNPFLKGVTSCTYIQLSLQNGEIYCQDSYESIMQMIKG